MYWQLIYFMLVNPITVTCVILMFHIGSKANQHFVAIPSICPRGPWIHLCFFSELMVSFLRMKQTSKNTNSQFLVGKLFFSNCGYIYSMESSFTWFNFYIMQYLSILSFKLMIEYRLVMMLWNTLLLCFFVPHVVYQNDSPTNAATPTALFGLGFDLRFFIPKIMHIVFMNIIICP